MNAVIHIYVDVVRTSVKDEISERVYESGEELFAESTKVGHGSNAAFQVFADGTYIV